MGFRYRKGVKGGCFFVTTSVVGHIPIFNIPKHAEIVLESLIFYTNKYNSDLISYALMPDHLHLIIALPENAVLSNFMRDFKKYTSVAIKKSLNNSKDDNSLKRKLQSYIPSRSSRSFKLWQDRFDDVSIYSEKVLLTKMNYIRNNPVKAELVDDADDYLYSSFYKGRQK